MKVIIAGSRNFENYPLLVQKLDRILKYCDKVEIVSGAARGADELGELYAVENHLNLRRFHADWDGLGNSAGYIRNEEMAKYADALIAFWDGRSRGTKHMIDLARKYNLKVRVIRFDQTSS